METSVKAGKQSRLTLVGLWGRFILKPPAKMYPELPEVEDATMHLAEVIGMRTVPHAMVRLKSGELAYILTGNADMHLKKFSLWSPSRNSFQLAPAYDLVATTLLIPGDTEESALALNGKKKNLRRKDFDALASGLGLAEKVRDNAYLKLGGSMDRWDASLERGFLSGKLLSMYSSLMRDRVEVLGLKPKG